MNKFLVQLLEKYLGESIEDINTLCESVGDFVGEFYFSANDFTYEELERELMWCVQEVFEHEHDLIDILLGDAGAEDFFNNYNVIDARYCSFDVYTRSVLLHPEDLCRELGIKLTSEVWKSLILFSNKINNYTTLKMQIK